MSITGFMCETSFFVKRFFPVTFDGKCHWTVLCVVIIILSVNVCIGRHGNIFVCLIYFCFVSLLFL